MVIRDVATRWNSTHAMIQRGYLLQEVCILSIHVMIIIINSFQAIDEWCFRNKECRGRLSLSENDWAQLHALESVLKVL